MKNFLLILFSLGMFSIPAAAAETAPLLVSAADMKPAGPWVDQPTRLVSSLPGYQTEAEPELSLYGGLKSRRFTAKGFFYATKSGARWWLVDPSGSAFINMAVVDVKIPGGSATVKENLEKKFGTSAQWAKATTEWLHAQGFNGSGGWSNDALLRTAPQRLVYTPVWNFMAEYGKRRGGTFQQPGHTGYPNDAIFVFDPGFAAFCDEYAQRLAPTKDDPWLLGHYSDNELPFRRKALDNFLALPDADSGHQAAVQWLAQWRHDHAGDSEITEAMRAAFLEFVADRYFQITTAAIRKVDPNHLCLGPRFHGETLLFKPVFVAAGRYLDVIAINYYRSWTPDKVQMKRWTDWSGKPFLVTEWYAKGMDSGYSNTTGAGFVVKTQADRGRFYQNFALGLLEAGNCVGWQWFKYLDNDPDDRTVDPSNTNSNKGMLTLKLEPYVPLTRAMSELNHQTYSLIDYFDAPQ